MIQTVRVISVGDKEGAYRKARVYRLEGVNKKSAKFLAEKLLSESITQKYSIDQTLFNKAFKKIEIAYRPGVMSPEVASILKSARDLGVKLKAADSSTEYYFSEKIGEKKARNIIKN